ncbi:hypothetical protein LTR37_020985 [Vermiconidia calcicola]|uniref:Uncharacterized protein n=1 Tax=Vermiconidia calcicola TaxID=1690605 RepID=A0ACC3MAX9_9PEZI|nr:hypothetical protein LTR37_020985 [Vermiconidia calcicola]
MAHQQPPDRARSEMKSEAMVGILTKTVAESPVIRWILHARIRRKRYNDVVFVGDDFIHVKQVKEGGHLQHIATKNDFDTRIRAARTFSNVSDAPDEDLFFKTEDSEEHTDGIPPQCVVLTLDSNDLLFLYLTNDRNGGFRFVHQALPMPTFDRLLFQPGEHLAVDPRSRALAVAANEREVVIYSAKFEDRIRHELQTGYQDWCPVSAQRPLPVEGVIQHIDFLYPPMDDNGADDNDHVILLLIVIVQRRTRAIWIDWYYSTDLHHATVHTGQPLDEAQSVPGLLIPLRNAAFLLVNGTEIKRWKGLLSGSASGQAINSMNLVASYPGASPRRPAWANWCRPRRGRSARSDFEHLYLIREDGQVYLVQMVGEKVETSHAGEFDCHVGTAFASLGDSRDPDILAVAGDMSSGRIQSIGNWFTPLRPVDLSRDDTMEMELIETIPNWASVTDMVVSTLPGKSQRPRDGVFLTSCRQPYGAITELRRGYEARLALYFQLSSLSSVTDIWALPLLGVGHILLVMSSPAGTQLLEMPAEAASGEIKVINDTALALDSFHRTLAAAVLEDARLLQITDSSICLTPGIAANFEDCARIDRPTTSILAAAIDTTQCIAVTAERATDCGSEYVVFYHQLRTDDPTAWDPSQLQRKACCGLESEPLSLMLSIHTSVTACLVATVDGRLGLFRIEGHGPPTTPVWKTIPAPQGTVGLCDSIISLRNNPSDSTVLAACGLRDGRLHTIVVNTSNDASFGEDRIIDFSQSTVKLTQPSGSPSIAYAMSGLDTCLLSWDGRDISSLNIQNIWVSDKLRPELAQGPVLACTHMPPAHLLSSPDLAESLVMISGDEFLVATLDRMVTSVPRQIPLRKIRIDDQEDEIEEGGTPNRLVYAEKQRCLVSASMRYGVRSFPSSLPHGKPEERRQIWPEIDFIPSRSSASSYTHQMQPGERVYALLEWSFKLSEDKTYSFIVVGGSYTRRDGSVRGRITFLQPVNKSWRVEGVKEGQSIKFDGPVYALASIGDLIFIVCTGHTVVAYEFATQERKWEQLCAPFKIASPGIHLSTNGMTVYISTNDDSLVTLELVSRLEGGAPANPEYDFELVAQTTAPRPDTSLHHLVPELQNLSDDSTSQSSISLTTTKHNQLLGLKHSFFTHANSAEILFEARLPRSLTRVRQCNIRPRWKASPPAGVLVDNIIGCAADGTLMGVALLDDKLWRRLSWLQRLCEWSEELSPHSFQTPAYSVGEGNYVRDERAMLIGFASDGEVVMRTSKPRVHDGHIDGDVLVRLLKKGGGGGVEMLKRVVRDVAAREDQAGEWMRRHLDEELGAVDEVVEVLRCLLDLWL